MIIDTHSRISPGLLQTPPSKVNKTAASADSESPAAASPPAETSDNQVILAAQNIASISPLQDAEAARAMMQKVRQNFLANPGSAMLAQANQVPENALRLLL
jgi:hypothetical protein